MTPDQVRLARCHAETEYCAAQPNTRGYGTPRSRTYRRVSWVYSRLYDAILAEDRGSSRRIDAVYAWVDARTHYSHIRAGQPITFPDDPP